MYLPHRKGQPLHFVHENSSPHLPVTLAQLMRPGIGLNVSYAVGDFTQHLGLFLYPGTCDSLIIHAYFNLFWPLLFFARPVTATANNMFLESRVHPFF